jgi:hypothetical protein
MSTKTYEGTVVNGSVQLPAGVQLPENARVQVVVCDERTAQGAHIHTPRLAHPQQADDFAMKVERAPDAGI